MWAHKIVFPWKVGFQIDKGLASFSPKTADFSSLIASKIIRKLSSNRVKWTN